VGYDDSFERFEVRTIVCAWDQFAHVKEGGSRMICVDVATDQPAHCARFSRNTSQR
jgi:hypothetical protein